MAVPALQRGRDDEAREKEEDQLVGVGLGGLSRGAHAEEGQHDDRQERRGRERHDLAHPPERHPEGQAEDARAGRVEPGGREGDGGQEERGSGEDQQDSRSQGLKVSR